MGEGVVTINVELRLSPFCVWPEFYRHQSLTVSVEGKFSVFGARNEGLCLDPLGFPHQPDLLPYLYSHLPEAEGLAPREG